MPSNVQTPTSTYKMVSMNTFLIIIILFSLSMPAISNNKSTSANTTKPANTDKSANTNTTPVAMTTPVTKTDSIWTDIFELAVIPVTLGLEYNETYDEKLKNKSSTYYENEKRTYEQKLGEIYNSSFVKNVTVTDFRNGSVIVVHTLNLKAKDIKPDEIRTFLMGVVVPALNNDPKVDQEYLKDVFTPGIKEAIRQIEATVQNPCLAQEVCPDGKTCISNGNKKAVCTSNSTDCDAYCHNDGRCYLSYNLKPICICKMTDDYIFSGDTCQYKDEDNLVMYIVAGTCGGVALILIVVILILLFQYRKTSKKANGKKTKDDNIMQDSRQPYTEIQPDYALPGLHKSGSRGLNSFDYDNAYDTSIYPRLGERDTSTRIYQPLDVHRLQSSAVISPPDSLPRQYRPADMNRMSQNHVRGRADSEGSLNSKFEFQRPQVSRRQHPYFLNQIYS